MAAGKSMTPLLENATSAIDLKWIEVTVLAGVDSPPPPPPPHVSSAPVYFPGSVGNVCALINIADSCASIRDLFWNQMGIMLSENL